MRVFAGKVTKKSLLGHQGQRIKKTNAVDNYMLCMPETSLHRIFGQLSDPRIDRKEKHLLIDIVILSVLAVLSGAKSWDSKD
jgi:hypothetical protein